MMNLANIGYFSTLDESLLKKRKVHKCNDQMDLGHDFFVGMQAEWYMIFQQIFDSHVRVKGTALGSVSHMFV